PHGSGGSTPPADPAEYSPQGHVEFYEQVRSALGLPALTVIGHSFGATTSITYAALAPQAVLRVIALAPLGLGTAVDEAEGGGAAAEMERAVSTHAGSAW